MILSAPYSNWEALLQDYSQKKFQQTPTYHVVNDSGPDHNKIFEIAVIVNEKEWGRGAGQSKKEAQQAAAANAMARLMDQDKPQRDL